MPRTLLPIVAAWLVLMAPVSRATQATPRLIAVGDIHGALAPFLEILQHAGLVNEGGRWSGGQAVLVQTGDYTDRGPDVRAVLDRLIALEREAAAAGGRVVVLLGNHEVMNLLGEQRDVTPAIYASFADGDSEARRRDAWEKYAALARARARQRDPLPEVYAQTREAWMAAHPPGWLEYREAFARRGHYGRWLRSRPIAARVGGALFMHAGVNPLAPPRDLEAIEAGVREEIARMDRFVERLVDRRLALPFFSMTEILAVAAAEVSHVNAHLAEARERNRPPDLSESEVALVREAAAVLQIGSWDVLAEHGPLWYRGYATSPDDVLREPLTRLLDRYRVSRIIVGHSPMQARRIQARLDGRILLIDTGMLAAAYMGRASALDLAADGLTAIYADGRQSLAVTPRR